MNTEILPRLTYTEQTLIRLFFHCVLENHGSEYQQAQQNFEQGLISKTTMPYLVYTGVVLIGRKETYFEAYMAKSWGHESVSIGTRPLRRRRHIRPIAHNDSREVKGEDGDENEWEVPCWSWNFNGAFAKKDYSQMINFTAANKNKKVEIVSLNFYPSQHADDETKKLLRRRGKTFWKCRSKNFLSYQAEEDDNFHKMIHFYSSRHPLQAIT